MLAPDPILLVGLAYPLAQLVALPLLLPLLPGQEISLLPILQLAYPTLVPLLYSLVSLSSEYRNRI